MAEANQISVADDLSKEITDLGQKIKDLPFGARVKKKYYPVRSAEELTCSAEELDTPYLISREYLDKFGYAGPAKDSGKKLLFLGMNPGAGAVETGVPFGEKELVKKQLKIVCENVGPWTFTGGNKESARLWELLLELFFTAEKGGNNTAARNRQYWNHKMNSKKERSKYMEHNF
ncbi:uncharacterized protein LOC108677285 [Hyalella azteca]|uniref:Uncharacterized protein LOC108677285 n=1 Tax=Hyalella azteca TaxID=294128 RepID=A0A8B7P777_HYAAZ|nr:uncharacterized protein LOC108677285 [Hyalella azteca]